MNRIETRPSQGHRRDRRRTEDRRFLLHFTCVWLASLVLLAVAWYIRPESPPERQVEARHAGGKVLAVPAALRTAAAGR